MVAVLTGWHWEEKNQMGWTKQKLVELLVGLLVDMSAVQGNAGITALKDLKGEVSLTADLHAPQQTGFFLCNVFCGTDVLT